MAKALPSGMIYRWRNSTYGQTITQDVRSQIIETTLVRDLVEKNKT